MAVDQCTFVSLHFADVFNEERASLFKLYLGAYCF